LYVNPAYEKIWGRPCASVYQNPHQWLETIHLDDRERIREAVVKKQAQGTYDEIYRISRPDGSIRWIRDRAYPVRNERGDVYRVVGTAEDITEGRKLEEQYRQSQKMEAIGTLAGGIAHDFNNILAAMNGYTELAKMLPRGDPKLGDYLDNVLKAGSRAKDLVQQILTFSRQQEQQRRRIQLAPVVEESLKLLRASIPSTIQFQITITPRLPTVLADPTQIHQIVMNLGTNAWHAMKDRTGWLRVNLENFVADAGFAEINPPLQPGPYVHLSVADTGCGMERAVQERIFEPFFTTKGIGEGTGLGLSVVHGIMQDHDGLITVYSTPGEGAIFHLYFPANAGPTAVPAAPAEATVSGAGKRVLFVDDEEMLARLGQNSLERLGYEVEARTSVAEALTRVRADPRRYDLVITDQTMPEMTGVEFAAALLKIRPDLPIILTTGYSPTLTAERVRALGIRELLLKPQTIQTLSATVQRALNGERVG
jgi:PAS domain S-box-containing protein